MVKVFHAFLAAVLCSAAFTVAGADAQPQAVSLGDRSFVHRWSKDNQNEFTPEEQADLTKWEEMVTLITHPNVTDGDQLANLANTVLGNYQRSGKILRTDSKPRTKKQPAEHLIVVILGVPGVMEAAFARVMLVNGRGLIVVYSRRAYGDGAAQTIGKWLQTNGPTTEKTLMEWTQYPLPSALKSLPQSK